jgi:hypothetical protein
MTPREEVGAKKISPFCQFCFLCAMKHNSFYLMCRPLMKFMTYSNQFKPPASAPRLLLWLLTNGSVVTITFLALLQLLIEAGAELGPALEIVTILITFVETCFRVVYLCCKQENIRSLMALCDRFPSKFLLRAFFHGKKYLYTRLKINSD